MGSHIALETDIPSKQRIVIPLHPALRLGAQSAILTAVARHKGVARERIRAGIR